MKTLKLKKSFVYALLALIIILPGCSAKKDLADLQESYNAQQKKLNKAQQENEKNLLELLSISKDNIDLKKENNELRSKLLSAMQSIREISEQEPECPEEMKKGLVFKVQIGAYEKRELPTELTKSVNLDTEEKNNLQRIIVGQFRNYEKAKSLKKQLRAMGVNDAFVVPYIDDERKQLDEVLADLSTKK